MANLPLPLPPDTIRLFTAQRMTSGSEAAGAPEDLAPESPSGHFSPIDGGFAHILETGWCPEAMRPGFAGSGDQEWVPSAPPPSPLGWGLQWWSP